MSWEKPLKIEMRVIDPSGVGQHAGSDHSILLLRYVCMCIVYIYIECRHFQKDRQRKQLN